MSVSQSGCGTYVARGTFRTKNAGMASMYRERQFTRWTDDIECREVVGFSRRKTGMFGDNFRRPMSNVHYPAVDVHQLKGFRVSIILSR